LKRYGFEYAASVLNTYNTVEKTRRTYKAAAAVFSQTHMSFPLPTSQVQLVPTLTQNEGY